MSRPRRLAPRYPAQLGARVITHGGEELNYPVRDVSRGGAFLQTDAPLEIFSEVLVHISLPTGALVSLPARVVHIMASAKAEALGIAPGMGLQFEPTQADHTAAIEALVDAARAGDHRARVPKRVVNSNHPRPDDPMLSYVYDAVDGKASPEVLAQQLSLELELLERLLGSLKQDGLVELIAPNADQEAPTEPTVNRQAATTAAAHDALPSGLAEELTDRLSALPSQDHYQTLGVTRGAEAKEIRAAFFALSKRFHPDAYFGRIDAAAQRRLERLFAGLAEAYGVLGRKRTRREYDDYLGRQTRLESAARSDRPEAAAPTHAAAPTPTPSEARVTATPATTVEHSAPPKDRGSGPAVPADGAASNDAERRRLAAERLKRTLSGTMHASRSHSTEPALPARCLAEAEAAIRDGRTEDAMRSLQLIAAMDAQQAVKERARTLRSTLMRTLAFEFEKKALYEERHQKWKAAARSWRRVCEGRPEDPHAFRQAARAYVEAGGDLRTAAKLAQRAVALAPSDASSHRVLGHVYLQAGMNANARASLEKAVSLNQGDPRADRMLKNLRRAV